MGKILECNKSLKELRLVDAISHKKFVGRNFRQILFVGVRL